MIIWKKIDDKEYESEDERFYIINMFDRDYGFCWKMLDKKDLNHILSYHEDSLISCQNKAESIIEKEDWSV